MAKNSGGAQSAAVSKRATLALNSRRTEKQPTSELIAVGSQCSGESIDVLGVAIDGLPMAYDRSGNSHNTWAVREKKQRKKIG